MGEMVVIDGVRYKVEDARRKGLLDVDNKKAPAPANKKRGTSTVSTARAKLDQAAPPDDGPEDEEE